MSSIEGRGQSAEGRESSGESHLALDPLPLALIKVADIASRTGYTISGDDSVEVNSLKWAADADESSLAVAFTDRDVVETRARVILTAPRLMPIDKTFIYCDFGEIDIALVKIARLMIEAGIYADYDKPIEQVERGRSMFGRGVAVGEGSYIAPFVSVGEDVRIGRHCKIESGVFIGSGSRIGDDVIIRSGSRVGANCHYHFKQGGRQHSFCGVGRTILEGGVEVGCNTVIQRGSLSDTVISEGTIIGNLVEIAHDVKIGKSCLIVSQVGICSNVTIGDCVEIYGQAGISNKVEIGDGAIILAKSGVTKDIRAGAKVSGMFSREHFTELRSYARQRL